MADPDPAEAAGGSRFEGLPRFDFSRRPLVAVWETTQACDLACLHCRAEAQPSRHPMELTTSEARDLLRQVRDLDPGVLVLSGGDPMKREDIHDLIRYGVDLGIRMAMTPSVTPLLTEAAVRELACSGLDRIAFSLDGSTPAVHDSFRGVDGSFVRTLRVMDAAREAGLSVQINTTVSRHNLDDLPALSELVAERDIVLWSVFFLVPVGRGKADQRISPSQYEEVFELLWDLRRKVSFEIKTTEAPHYRRFVVRKMRRERAASNGRPRFRYTSLNVNDGKGFVFVSHTGEVFPSGFLASSVGNIRRRPLAGLYRHTSLMRKLRDPKRLEGKCGYCEFRGVCGGSRARAWALTGNPLAAEPDCVYRPAGPPAPESAGREAESGTVLAIT
jgi:AdoMet-dependent heme synthase